MTKYQESSISNSAYNGCGCLLLLMGIVVIGASALPSFLPHAGKPKGSEAKHYVNAMNKAQHAHFVEKGAFATSVNALGIGIKTETANYKYSVRTTKKVAFNYGVSKDKELKTYVGGVFGVPAKEVEQNAAKEEITTTSILCQADFSGTIKPAEPTYQNGKLVCGTSTTEVTK